jgi:hypothetical protein
MRNILFAFLFLPFAAFTQTKSLGLEVVFCFEGDTVDSRFLEPYLIAYGYEETKAWATKAVFVEKCKAKGVEIPLETFDAMMREKCGHGLKDYVTFYNEMQK